MSNNITFQYSTKFKIKSFYKSWNIEISLLHFYRTVNFFETDSFKPIFQSRNISRVMLNPISFCCQNMLYHMLIFNTRNVTVKFQIIEIYYSLRHIFYWIFFNKDAKMFSVEDKIQNRALNIEHFIKAFE